MLLYLVKLELIMLVSVEGRGSYKKLVVKIQTGRHIINVGTSGSAGRELITYKYLNWLFGGQILLWLDFL